MVSAVGGARAKPSWHGRRSRVATTNDGGIDTSRTAKTARPLVRQDTLNGGGRSPGIGFFSKKSSVQPSMDQLTSDLASGSQHSSGMKSAHTTVMFHTNSRSLRREGTVSRNLGVSFAPGGTKQKLTHRGAKTLMIDSYTDAHKSKSPDGANAAWASNSLYTRAKLKLRGYLMQQVKVQGFGGKSVLREPTLVYKDRLLERLIFEDLFGQRLQRCVFFIFYVLFLCQALTIAHPIDALVPVNNHLLKRLQYIEESFSMPMLLEKLREIGLQTRLYHPFDMRYRTRPSNTKKAYFKRPGTA